MRDHSLQILAEKYETVIELAMDNDVTLAYNILSSNFPNRTQLEDNFMAWTSLVHRQGAGDFKRLTDLYNTKGPRYFTNKLNIRAAVTDFVNSMNRAKTSNPNI